MPNPLYTYILNIKIYRIWFGWVLWHINHCRLKNAKSALYIHIKYIGFGLVGFYSISTGGVYVMPNPLHTYIYVDLLMHRLLITFLNEPGLICLRTIK